MGQLWSHYLVNEEEVGKAFSMFNQKRAFIQSDIRGKYKTAFQPHCRNSWEGSPKLLPLPFQRPSLWASYLMAWADIELWMSDWQKKLIKPLIISKLQEDLTLEGINMDSVQRFLVWQWGQPTNLYNEHPVPAWPLVLFLSLLLNDYLEQSWSLEKKKKKVLQSWLTYIDIAGGNIFTQPQKAAAQLSLLWACTLLKWMQI